MNPLYRVPRLSLLRRDVRPVSLRTSPCTCSNINRPTQRWIANHPDTLQSSIISVLPTTVDTSSAEFKQNALEMNQRIAELEELHLRIAQGGPLKNREKHIARGKMLARESVEYHFHEPQYSL